MGFWLSACGGESGPEDDGGAQDASTGQEAGSNQDAGNQGGTDAGAKDGGGTDAAATDSSKKVGTFTIKLTAPVPASGGSSASEGYTSIAGKVFDRPVPQETIWETDMEQGGCKLVKPRVPFCEKPCGSSVCVEDDQCAPNAVAQSVGTVVITGLRSKAGSAEIKIEPLGTDPSARVYSTPGDVELPYPAFSEGDEIKLSAQGGMLSGFTLATKGIAPLELSTSAFPLKMGSALSLAWKAGKADVSRLFVKLDISHHGGTKGKIECDVADSGSFEVPAPLITRLLGLGVAGFPTIAITRSSKASAQLSVGTVELQVVEEVERAVQIDGLVSCSGDGDCPTGKRCQADLSCK